MGSIPDSVTLLGREPAQVRLPDALATEPGETVSVVEVYVSDASNKKTLESGRRWARGYSLRGTSTDKPYEITRPNVPMTGLRILGLEKRGNGGRAYKVVLPDSSHYVDLREDVLLDAVFCAGVAPGGVLGGEYVFARVASEMKLVRVGSSLHKKLVADSATKRTPVVGLANLVPGHAYETKGGMVCVYLGRVDSEQHKFEVGSAALHSRESRPLYAAQCERRNVQCWLNYEGGRSGYGGARDWRDRRPVGQVVDAAFVVDRLGYLAFVADRGVVRDLGPTLLGPDPIVEVRGAAREQLRATLADPSKNDHVRWLRGDVAQRCRIGAPGAVRPEVERAIVYYSLAEPCGLRAAGSPPVPVDDPDVSDVPPARTVSAEILKEEAWHHGRLTRQTRELTVVYTGVVQ